MSLLCAISYLASQLYDNICFDENIFWVLIVGNITILHAGRNQLTGTIPNELFGSTETIAGQECKAFRNPVKKIGLMWLAKIFPSTDAKLMESLQILSLRKWLREDIYIKYLLSLYQTYLELI